MNKIFNTDKQYRCEIKNLLLIIFILIVACLLRLYNFFEIPFTHDEFSALFRIRFNSFSELIIRGVRPDGHPAGIHVLLYYWTRLFGFEEFIVKIPFVLFGILSVWLIYLIARKWYNETVALIAATFLASLQFPIIYSQIARMYISGLFFSLLMVFFWSKIMFKPHKKFYLNSFFYILASALCAYNHHFSLLFAFIVGVSGLFYVRKKYLLKYIASGVIIFLLYTPHLKIFFYQLRVEGVYGWLGKPHFDFIFNYIGYIFHFSIFSYLLLMALVILGFYKQGKSKIKNKYFILSATWFMLPFLVGFIYSILVNAVLQYSMLLFSMPFLFFSLFGHIKEQKFKINVVIVLVILLINILTLIFERKHYEIFYKSAYENILIEHDKNILKENSSTLSIIDFHEKISPYYILQHDIDTNFIHLDRFGSEKELILFLDSQSRFYDKIYYGCIAENHPQFVPVILDYYPSIDWQINYAGGTSYLFSKNLKTNNSVYAISQLNFESEKLNWLTNKENFIDTISCSEEFSYLIDTTMEYTPVYSNKLKKIISNKNDFIDISVKVYTADKLNDVILVSSLEWFGKTIDWRGTPFTNFIVDTLEAPGWVKIHHTIKLADVHFNHMNPVLKTYVWNKGKQYFIIDDFVIKLRKGNPVLYGLNEKI